MLMEINEHQRSMERQHSHDTSVFSVWFVCLYGKIIHELQRVDYRPYRRMNYTYCNFPKNSDTQNICCNHSKIWTMWLYHRVMSPNDADGMENSVDPDQEQSDLGLHCLPTPLGAVWSGQAYLSENLGSLR